MKIICFGDSITQGLGDEEKSSFPALLGAVNLGVSGNHTQSLLTRMEEIKEFSEAKYVVLLIGTNDASLGNPQHVFETNYALIIEQLRGMGKKLILLTIPRELYRTELNPLIEGYNHFIRKFAHPLIELWDIEEKYFVDGEHFNHEGNLHVADLIAAKVAGLEEPMLYLTESQTVGLVSGYQLKKEMEGKKVGTQDDLDFLLKNQQVIPEDWKGKWIIFWGTATDKDVKMMHFTDKWVEGTDLLEYNFDHRSPALIF